MKPHRIDSISLVFGALFVGIVIWWGLAQVFDFSAAAAGWVAAITLLGLGIFGILTSAMSHRARSTEAADTTSDDPHMLSGTQ